MPNDEKKGKPGWYVVHTYSGYENKVKMDLEKTVKNRHLEDWIFDVVVPVQKSVELRKSAKGAKTVKREIDRKMFPGYVLVKMIQNDDTWYVVRNTRGVTGFVGPGSEPVPLTDEEMEALLWDEQQPAVSTYEVGDTVMITAGAWENTIGVVKSVDNDNQKLTITTDMFNGDTPMEVDMDDVKPVQ